MNNASRLVQRKNEILAQLAALGPMRKGSLNEQYFQATRKDGSITRQGPYCVYTYKENGKTISRRLTCPGKVALHREQIATFRRFQELSAELVHVSQTLADLEAADDEGSKKNSSR